MPLKNNVFPFCGPASGQCRTEGRPDRTGCRRRPTEGPKATGEGPTDPTEGPKGRRRPAKARPKARPRSADRSDRQKGGRPIRRPKAAPTRAPMQADRRRTDPPIRRRPAAASDGRSMRPDPTGEGGPKARADPIRRRPATDPTGRCRPTEGAGRYQAADA